MTQYEREQIVKALRCICGEAIRCNECGYNGVYPYPICRGIAPVNAITLINELLEDNKAKDETITSLLDTIKDIQADTVRKMKESVKEVKAAMWDIICAEGVEVTNQNLDWLIERAVKVVVRRDEG